MFDEVRKDIWPAVESRKLQLPIDKVYKFDEIGKAFEHMEANKHLGKIDAVMLSCPGRGAAFFTVRRRAGTYISRTPRMSRRITPQKAQQN